MKSWLCRVYDDLKGRFQFSVRMPQDDLDQGAAIELDCATQHYIYVEEAWQWRTQPAESAIQAARIALGECLTAAGHEPQSKAPSDEDIDRMIEDPRTTEATARCLTEVARETGVQLG